MVSGRAGARRSSVGAGAVDEGAKLPPAAVEPKPRSEIDDLAPGAARGEDGRAGPGGPRGLRRPPPLPRGALLT